MDFVSEGWLLIFGLGIPVLMFFLAIWVFGIICVWKVYEKASKPGWASIVPIYNFIVLLEIAELPIWWVILMLIPGVNIVIFIIALNGLSRNFGQGAGFTVGLVLLPYIFWAILAFGNYQFQGDQFGSLEMD